MEDWGGRSGGGAENTEGHTVTRSQHIKRSDLDSSTDQRKPMLFVTMVTSIGETFILRSWKDL